MYSWTSSACAKIINWYRKVSNLEKWFKYQAILIEGNLSSRFICYFSFSLFFYVQYVTISEKCLPFNVIFAKICGYVPVQTFYIGLFLEDKKKERFHILRARVRKGPVDLYCFTLGRRPSQGEPCNLLLRHFFLPPILNGIGIVGGKHYFLSIAFFF